MILSFILLLLFCCALDISAQPALPDEVLVGLPAVLAGNEAPAIYKLRLDFHNGSKWGQSRKAGKALWVAYSDRAENPTYNTPDKSSRYGELMFGEKVCIADIKGDMALVYSDENNHYPQIPKSIKSKGWVPMDNLLLWRRCPKDHSGVLRKGIVSNSKFKEESATFYVTPDNLNTKSFLTYDLRFYYIMKESADGQFLLLSTSAILNSAQSLYGWVRRSDFVELNQRVFVEPNWDPKYVEDNCGNNIYIYEDEEGSRAISHWEYGTVNGDTNQLYKYRFSPSRLRFPVLSRPNANGMVATTFLGDISSFDQEFLKRKMGMIHYENKKQIRHILSYGGYIKQSPGWRYVMLLSQDDIKEFINALAPLYSSALEHSNFTNVLESLIKERLQRENNEMNRNYDDLSLEKIHNMIYGTEMVENVLFSWGNHSLKDMKNLESISDSVYFDFLDRFERRYREFKNYISCRDCRMDLGGMYYYWIPMEELP